MQGPNAPHDVLPPPVTEAGKPLNRSYDWHVEPPRDSEPEGWLLSYLDVMTLILVMLVVLLAFSDREIGVGMPDAPPTTEYTGAESVFDAGSGIFELPAARPRSDDEGTPSASVTRDTPDFEPLLGIDEDAFGDDVQVSFEDGRVNLRISSEILFPSAQAELSARGLELLTRVADLLAQMEYTVAVEGHTDNLPIMTPRFPSNWELSTARATSVVRHLAANGVVAERLRATGFAETRPVADNTSADGRAANRRVELVLEQPRPR